MNGKRIAIVVGVLVVLLLLAKPVVHLVNNVQTEKRLAGLLPEVRAALEELRRRLLAQGIKTQVGQTLRDDAQQAAVVESGNSATQNSWHKVGRAVDLYPFDPITDEPDLAGHNLELFRTMHNEAARLGFRGLAFNADGSKKYITGKKGKVWDGGHLEYPGGMTYAAATADYQRRKATA